MYRSYSYSNMPEPVAPKHKSAQKPTPEKPEKKSQRSFFGNMELDDIILLVIIFALIANDCDDRLLLIALAYIFISDYVN